ncbi:MAG: flavodoxin-dependent (E)-4-hydroxy-3-methylbut-2-enyl-diphosphate synthase, partial [bacterium]
NVAVMGCEVNGPGEARNADFGIAFAGDKAIYFENGKIIKTLEKKSAAGFLIQKIKQFLTPVTPLG